MPGAECQASRPLSRAAPSEASCLVCAACGQVICTEDSVLRDRCYLTLRKAVYAYELSVLSAPAWCYSATGQTGDRFDILLLEEVCVGRAQRSPGRFGGAHRAAGVVATDTQAPPSDDNSWFPGYNFQAVRCGGCSIPRHLGWAFTSDGSSARAPGGNAPLRSFFGLVVTRLRERPLNAATGFTPSVSFPLGGFGPRLRGLSASTVSGTCAAAAAGAARGRNAMPSQLIPSTSSTAAPVSICLKGWEGDADSASGSESEAEDFELQRRARRCQSYEVEVSHRTSQASSGSARGACMRPARTVCRHLAARRGGGPVARSEPVGAGGNWKNSRSLPPLAF